MFVNNCKRKDNISLAFNPALLSSALPQMKRKAAKARSGDASLLVRLPEGDHDLAMQKLVYDYLVSAGLTTSAKSLSKEVSVEAKYFKSLHCPDSLHMVYSTYLKVKEVSKSIDFTESPPPDEISQLQKLPNRWVHQLHYPKESFSVL